MSTEAAPLTAIQKRAAHPEFVPTFSLEALKPQLPFPLLAPSQVSPSPKRRYRSYYQYLGYTDQADEAALRTLTDFEIALRLIDFAPLRDYLAANYYRSARGHKPFDPVSLALCACLRREQNCSWRKLAKLLAGEHGAGWRRLFGFRTGDTPSASGLRYFFDTVGVERFEELCSLVADLVLKAGLAPVRSTYPGDPPGRGVTISHDIMLHEAYSKMDCGQVQASCYQKAPRPCPARQAGKEGCDCSAKACQEGCRRATPRDPEARLIHYDGDNKHAKPGHGRGRAARNVHGYASNPDRLVDDRFGCAWTLRTGLHPANSDERNLFPESFKQLRQRFPDLKIGEVLGDAALGYDDCLDPIWDAGALRMIAIRAADGDDNPKTQRQRGYDANGHPLCVHGFPMHPNGHDYERRRTKWCCEKACLNTAAQDPERPAPDCPFAAPEHKHGQIVNVGHSLPDGSRRLAREVPYDSEEWHKRYGRRNNSEGRNGNVQHMGAKRMTSCGQTRDRKENGLVDGLGNLRTLGRLVGEATLLAMKANTG
jgi:hypothetical protein